MQICDCDVLLAGSRNHVVRKNRVSVAEIEVLRAMHGDDAVLNIQPRETKKIASRDELERLRRRYRRQLNTAGTEGRKSVVDAVYPGNNPTLPTTLADIGVEYTKGGRTKKAASKEKAEAKAAEEADSVVVGEDGTGPAADSGAPAASA